MDKNRLQQCFSNLCEGKSILKNRIQEYAANVVTDDNTQATDNKASGTAVKKGMKDHRTNEENSNVNAVMDGDIDSFINAYLKKIANG